MEALIYIRPSHTHTLFTTLSLYQYINNACVYHYNVGFILKSLSVDLFNPYITLRCKYYTTITFQGH